METASYFHSSASFLTPATIALAVSFGPEGNFAPLLLTGGKNLDVSSAYINSQNVHQ